MRRAIVASVLAAIVATAAASSWAAPDFAGMNIQPYDPPKPAPAFALPDLDGKLHTLGDFRGKVLMLFFWATW
ncbi:MAG TPA: redoxin domain-containing protein [Methylomirabilota bacterium]|jgi:cytochrome oxidase Cu insertion factor (SCO1/SenC/PrrC family)|nr:redoxin domain-containing protein [Methylomirabilota bacterium]